MSYFSFRSLTSASLLSLLSFSQPLALFSSVQEQQFTEIYERKIWGQNEEGQGCSGDGSSISATENYRIYLAGIISSFNIKSVVDAGCGDWGFSHTIDWSGIDYKGFDVVRPVVERNQDKYTQSNVHFYHANLIETDLPSADLLICKDVLQHLPLEDVAKFIKQFPKYKYCLITNDVDVHTGTCENRDVGRDILAYRLLDITKPPFNVVPSVVFTYRAPGVLKQVLLIKNEKLIEASKTASR